MGNSHTPQARLDHSAREVVQVQVTSHSLLPGHNSDFPPPDYFYGFLVTFAVLLFIFVGCGIRTRRRYFARRQLLLEQLGFWDEDRGQLLPSAVPRMWEYYTGDKGKPTSYQWESLSPLAVLPTQPNTPLPTTIGSTQATSSIPPRNVISKFLSGYKQNPSTATAPPDKSDVEQFREYQAAQVAVIIQLPVKSQDPDAFPSSMIGVSEVSCSWSVVADKRSSIS